MTYLEYYQSIADYEKFVQEIEHDLKVNLYFYGNSNDRRKAIFEACEQICNEKSWINPIVINENNANY